MNEKTISSIKAQLKAAPDSELIDFIREYENDPRGGVMSLVAQARKRQERLAAEMERIERLRIYEDKYSDYKFICGIDEVGRGPLAGPVAAAAVILPKDCRILYINDSKKLSPKKREALYDVIMEEALSVGIGMASPQKIDEINIL
ncbi:MAG: ribonuclease HII, partial [Clostridiales bacterium]|nr:ribonuclease HII [Clostridiales bacterium]